MERRGLRAEEEAKEVWKALNVSRAVEIRPVALRPEVWEEVDWIGRKLGMETEEVFTTVMSLVVACHESPDIVRGIRRIVMTS